MTTREQRKLVRDMRGKYTYNTAPINRMFDTHVPHSHKYKPPSNKGAPLRYRVHVIRNVGHKESMIWIPLACYKHLSGAYKKVTSLRAHFNKHHNNHQVLRDYTIFIEFRGTGMIRAFNLTPEYSLNSARTSSTPGMGSSFSTSWYTPKSWIMHDEYRRSRTKKRPSASSATSVPITGAHLSKTKPDKGKSKTGQAKGKCSTQRTTHADTKQNKRGCSLPAPDVSHEAMLDMLNQVVRYFQALVPPKSGQTAHT